MRAAMLLGCVLGCVPAAWAQPISFADALARAGADSPTVAGREAALESATLSIKPAGALPDPQLALGLDNVPVTGPDRYRLGRDEMTMLSIGVMQDMPSGAARRARTGLAEADARAARAGVDIARLEARRAAADAWIDLFYGGQRVALLETLVRIGEELETASAARLGAGVASADAALAARLDAAQVADRLAEARSDAAMAAAVLERWIGPLNGDRLGAEAPVLAIDADALRAHIPHHVQLVGAAAAVTRAEAELDVAEAARKSDWSWSVMYQKRDDMFGDMVSLGFKFSLPLFQSTRQQPAVDARLAGLRAAGAEREALLREHRAMLEARLAEYASLNDRYQRARDVVAPAAKRREAIAETAQASNAASVADLLRARIDAGEAELDRLDLERRLMRAAAALTLEYGEAKP